MSRLAFTDPVFESQAAFRAILAAMARPGAIHPCGQGLEPPAPLSPAAAAAILALADVETPLWIAPPCSATDEISAYLRFHTGAPLAAAPNKAVFALTDAASDALRLADFAQGAPNYPDRSTTLIVQVSSLAQGQRFALAGPGVCGKTMLVVAQLPKDFIGQWATNRAAFPLGVDCILASGAEVATLPRSVRLTGES
jgi:alpha-D-ribose 1-methylphosphonate 5-triphosphate synthase subunit PhnH